MDVAPLTQTMLALQMHSMSTKCYTCQNVRTKGINSIHHQLHQLWKTKNMSVILFHFPNSIRFTVIDLLLIQAQRNPSDAWSASATTPHLMLITQVCLQVTQLSAIEIAQSALVGFDIIVLLHVRLQVLSTATCECAFVAAEDDASKVM